MTPKMTPKWAPKWCHFEAKNGSKTLPGRLRNQVWDKSRKNIKFDYPLNENHRFLRRKSPQNVPKWGQNHQKTLLQNAPKQCLKKVTKKWPKRLQNGTQKRPKNVKKTKIAKTLFFKIQKIDFQFFSGRKLGQKLAQKRDNTRKSQKHWNRWPLQRLSMVFEPKIGPKLTQNEPILRFVFKKNEKI